jgi:hypothetical protein
MHSTHVKDVSQNVYVESRDHMMARAARPVVVGSIPDTAAISVAFASMRVVLFLLTYNAMSVATSMAMAKQHWARWNSLNVVVIVSLNDSVAAFALARR